MREKRFNWEIMLANYREAWGELDTLLGEVTRLSQADADNPDSKFRVFALRVSLGHAYHHVNFAWNSRHVDEARVIRCETKDFNDWDRFPRCFKRLWPSPSQCKVKPREVGCSGRLVLEPIRRNVKEAVAEIEALYKAIEAKVPMTEAELAERMVRLYQWMNRIWNERGLKDPQESLSAERIRRHSLFPRSFKGHGVVCL